MFAIPGRFGVVPVQGMGWAWVQAVGEGGVAPAGSSGADGGGQGANHLDPVTPPHLPGGEAGSRGLPAGNFSSGLTSASPPGCVAQPTPTEGRSSVSTKQRENLEAVLRLSAFPSAAMSASSGGTTREPSARPTRCSAGRTSKPGQAIA